ncbi:MAG: Hsp20/alpha crystallin family protein [Patescibacteria group bacterium]|nr:Hsp20/alpha crystallin family protein [Patescibacteria group bacterium]
MAKKSFFARFLQSKQVADNPNPPKPPVSHLPTPQTSKPEPTPIQVQQQPQPQQQTQQTGSQNSQNDQENYEGQLAIDVFQTPQEIIIKSTIAGVNPEDIDINIDNDMVTIKGERKNIAEAKENDYYYQECYWGAFSRSIILPEEVVADNALAELKNGILTIRLPKANAVKTKKIEVKMANDQV